MSQKKKVVEMKDKKETPKKQEATFHFGVHHFAMHDAEKNRWKIYSSAGVAMAEKDKKLIFSVPTKAEAVALIKHLDMVVDNMDIQQSQEMTNEPFLHSGEIVDSEVEILEDAEEKV